MFNPIGIDVVRDLLRTVLTCYPYGWLGILIVYLGPGTTAEIPEHERTFAQSREPVSLGELVQRLVQRPLHANHVRFVDRE